MQGSGSTAQTVNAGGIVSEPSGTREAPRVSGSCDDQEWPLAALPSTTTRDDGIAETRSEGAWRARNPVSIATVVSLVPVTLSVVQNQQQSI